MIVLHASFPIDRSERDEALELIEGLVEASNREEGMVEYRAAADVQDENLIRFFERYEDEAAFRHHTQTDHFQAFEARLPELLAGQPAIHRFDVTEATELEV